MNLIKLTETLKSKFNVEKLEYSTGADDIIKVTIDGVTYEKTYCFGEPLESIIEFINVRQLPTTLKGSGL